MEELAYSEFKTINYDHEFFPGGIMRALQS